MTATVRRGGFGDLGWLLERHVAVYLGEFGYAPVFAAYVAESLGPFIRHHDPRRDALWVAWLDGRRVGCIALQHDPTRRGWAKLRWFLLEREARGHGLGRRLMATALRFARRAGYRGVLLWTVDDLGDARRLYESSGFRLAEQTAGCEWAPWGHEQRWELRLPPARQPGAARGRKAPGQAGRRALRRA